MSSGQFVTANAHELSSSFDYSKTNPVCPKMPDLCGACENS